MNTPSCKDLEPSGSQITRRRSSKSRPNPTPGSVARGSQRVSRSNPDSDGRTGRPRKRSGRRLEEQSARRTEPRPPVLEIALRYGVVDRERSAAEHREHRDHNGPKHAEFVATFRQRPYIADVKMSAPQHRHQQIHRSEQCNGACDESQYEADRADELDRSGE